MRHTKQTRRRFLGKAAHAAAVWSAAWRLEGANHKRPNILFCISDDQSYPHAGAYGTKWVQTPAFDRVAREGILFHNAFVSSPSCCPSRGSVLAGQDFYRLREASMNHTIWPGGIPVYPDLLAEAGYETGFTGKGWGPGNWEVSGREYSPAGPAYNEKKIDPPGEHMSEVDYAGNFETFLEKKPAEKPFCFWVGFSEPHRVYDEGIGARHGKSLGPIKPPDFFPDSRTVRSDLADYAFEIEYFDGHLAKILKTLEDRGELDNTLIVVTADNGMPFPRAKATVYDYGARMPLAIRWGGRIKAGRVVEDFVSFTDFAPTFLEAAGGATPSEMTGKSLMPVLLAPQSGRIDPDRDRAVFGIERHFPGSRPEGAGYPIRAIRTRDYLYIRNLTPERNPMGDRPGTTWPDDDPTGGFGDCDGGPTKTYMFENREKYPELYRLSFAKRPAEELYAVRSDPYNMYNLGGDPGYAQIKKLLAAMLDRHLKQTKDPRVTGDASMLDAIMKKYPVLGSNQ